MYFLNFDLYVCSFSKWDLDHDKAMEIGKDLIAIDFSEDFEEFDEIGFAFFDKEKRDEFIKKVNVRPSWEEFFPLYP